MNNHTSSLLSKYLQSVGAAALTVCASAVAQEFHLRLNGPSDFVTVNHDQRFDTQTFTVTAWVRTVSSPPTTPVDPRLQLAIVSRGNSSGHRLPWRLAIRQDGTLGLLWESVADGDLVGPTACPGPTCTWPVVNDGSWHFVGVSMSLTPGLGGGVTYVVDHHSHFESRPSNHAPTIDSASAVTFGAELTMGVPSPSTALARTATADLDQITIWDRALSAPEILALRTRNVDFGAVGLAGYWKMEEGSGTAVFDCALPASNGSIVGAPTWIPFGPAPQHVTDLGFGAPGILTATRSPVDVALTVSSTPNTAYFLLLSVAPEYLNIPGLPPGLVFVPGLDTVVPVVTNSTGVATHSLAWAGNCTQIIAQAISSSLSASSGLLVQRP